MKRNIPYLLIFLSIFFYAKSATAQCTSLAPYSYSANITRIACIAEGLNTDVVITFFDNENTYTIESIIDLNGGTAPTGSISDDKLYLNKIIFNKYYTTHANVEVVLKNACDDLDTFTYTNIINNTRYIYILNLTS